MEKIDIKNNFTLENLLLLFCGNLFIINCREDKLLYHSFVITLIFFFLSLLGLLA